MARNSATVVFLLMAWLNQAAAESYSWLTEYDSAQSIEQRIPAPTGFTRPALPPGSFAAWLRGLPLKPGRPAVLLFDGNEKRNQAAHHAVINIDTGSSDLQQCADAVMRLRAEYLFSAGRSADIAFNFTSGDKFQFSRWAQGIRPAVNGNKVVWQKRGQAGSSHAALRAYLDTIFMYAGSHSLSRELRPLSKADELHGGAVFIRGGFPGHAAIVLDVATGPKGVRFLLAQSYMPAQDMHVLRNPADPEGGPWYDLNFGPALITPEWIFTAKELMAFKD